MNIFKGFSESVSVLKKDKWIVVFSIMPVLIGLLLYIALGTYLYTDLLTIGVNNIESQISSETFGKFVVYLLVTILTVLYYFLINWTFTLLIAALASPFSDVISKRSEKAYLGEEAESLMDSLSYMGRGFFSTILNELKKISFILSVTIVSFFLSFFPLLLPVTAVLSANLMSASFLDYSWARKGLSFAECLAEIRKGFLIYSISGFLFLFLVSVPFVNLFVIPLGVIYFTIVHTQRQLSA